MISILKGRGEDENEEKCLTPPRFCRSTLYIERECDFFIEAGKTKRLHFHPD